MLMIFLGGWNLIFCFNLKCNEVNSSLKTLLVKKKTVYFSPTMVIIFLFFSLNLIRKNLCGFKAIKALKI